MRHRDRPQVPQQILKRRDPTRPKDEANGDDDTQVQPQTTNQAIDIGRNISIQSFTNVDTNAAAEMAKRVCCY